MQYSTGWTLCAFFVDLYFRPHEALNEAMWLCGCSNLPSVWPTSVNEERAATRAWRPFIQLGEDIQWTFHGLVKNKQDVLRRVLKRPVLKGGWDGPFGSPGMFHPSPYWNHFSAVGSNIIIPNSLGVLEKMYDLYPSLKCSRPYRMSWEMHWILLLCTAMPFGCSDKI